MLPIDLAAPSTPLATPLTTPFAALPAVDSTARPVLVVARPIGPANAVSAPAAMTFPSDEPALEATDAGVTDPGAGASGEATGAGATDVVTPAALLAKFR